MSAPQNIGVGAPRDRESIPIRREPCRPGIEQICVGAPTGRLPGVGEQTCRPPSKLTLGSRQGGYLALGADVSAPQEIEPTEFLNTSSRVINLNISKQIINK